MTRTLLLCIALLSFTACGKEEAKPPVCTTKPIQPIKIIDKPIDFGPDRIAMTKEYIKSHYGKVVDNIEITPKIILLHWTAEMDFDKSFKRLLPEKLLSDRKDIVKASALNVSSQFLVARDGTIYRLMPENWMARHVIGLNYSSIGIENVGGKGNKIDDLTPAQRQANIDLVFYLKSKYPSIEYLVGHHEYKQMESTSLWLEKDKGYRTVKSDPGEKFMNDIRNGVKCLDLKTPPKGK
ncbi:MAG: peptidoglycan recognition family protein [Sulfurovum sp.]|uniref:peptidoglycan recognition protein family protein n=1 Tax=Sulfurovum sp. TaxID=1969726 RepID=UPI003C751D0E